MGEAGDLMGSWRNRVWNEHLPGINAATDAINTFRWGFRVMSLISIVQVR